ncbi:MULTISPECIES: hypothetical protein [Pectobacterium]|nr:MULTISPECIES: hypothetical protein [Pectobacterium]
MPTAEGEALCATPHQEPNPGGQPHTDAEADRSAPLTCPAPT